MPKEKQEKLEREYVIPLRKHWRKAPVYKRSKRAINALKRFVQQHMKAEPKIGKELNELILQRGHRHPPAKVHVTIIKEGNIAKVNLFWVKKSAESSRESAERRREPYSEARGSQAVRSDTFSSETRASQADEVGQVVARNSATKRGQTRS